MILIPADFLAGALLSLLLPTIMLTALVVWYMRFIRRVPESTDGQESSRPGPAAGAPTDGAGAPDR